MTIKKSIIAVSAIILLAAGYIAGAYIGLPNTDKEQLSGDISKANIFDDEDPDIQALSEALKTDSALQQKAVLSAIILSSKTNDIDAIADASIEATEGIKVLANANKAMKALKKKIANAKNAEQQYLEATGKLIAGEKVDDYEKICSNALLSYTILDSKLSSCQDYIDLFSEYLEESDNQKLQNAFSLWMAYCGEDAVLKNDESALLYWKKSAEGSNATAPTITASVDKAIEACKKETTDENIIRILGQLSGHKVEAQNAEASVMKQCQQVLVGIK